MIKPELTFFQMQVERLLIHAAKAAQSRLGEAPETFDAINMRICPGKLITAMVHA